MSIDWREPRVLQLICAKCGGYWDMWQGENDMAARELGDGTICVGCPNCHADIAVISDSSACTRDAA